MDPELKSEIEYWATAAKQPGSKSYRQWNNTLEKWVDKYSAGNSGFRTAFRFAVKSKRHLPEYIEGYANFARKKLRNRRRYDYLKRGLLAISLADCPNDYRDTLSTLSILVAEAEQSQLEPLPLLKEIAMISSDQENGGMRMKQTLANFHTSAALAEARRIVKQ